MKEFAQKILNTPETVRVAIRGDASDGLGLAIFSVLKKLDRKVVLTAENGVEKRLAWLPNADVVIKSDDFEQKVVKVIFRGGGELKFHVDKDVKDKDTIFELRPVDCELPERIDLVRPTVGSTMVAVCVDGASVDAVTKIDVKNTEDAFELVKSLGDGVFDGEIATMLYASLIFETDSFTNMSTTGNVLNMAHELINFGADYEKVIQKCLRTQTPEQLKLWGSMLGNLKIEKNIAVVFATENDFLETGTGADDVPGIIDQMLRHLPDVEYAVTLWQTDVDVHGVVLKVHGDGSANDFVEKWGGNGDESRAVFSLEKTGVKEAMESVFGGSVSVKSKTTAFSGGVSPEEDIFAVPEVKNKDEVLNRVQDDKIEIKKEEIVENKEERAKEVIVPLAEDPFAPKPEIKVESKLENNRSDQKNRQKKKKNKVYLPPMPEVKKEKEKFTVSPLDLDDLPKGEIKETKKEVPVLDFGDLPDLGEKKEEKPVLPPVEDLSVPEKVEAKPVAPDFADLPPIGFGERQKMEDKPKNDVSSLGFGIPSAPKVENKDEILNKLQDDKKDLNFSDLPTPPKKEEDKPVAEAEKPKNNLSPLDFGDLPAPNIVPEIDLAK